DARHLPDLWPPDVPHPLLVAGRVGKRGIGSVCGAQALRATASAAPALWAAGRWPMSVPLILNYIPVSLGTYGRSMRPKSHVRYAWCPRRMLRPYGSTERFLKGKRPSAHPDKTSGA